MDEGGAERDAVEQEAQPPESDRETEVTVLGARTRATPGSAHVLNNRTLERFDYDDPHAALQLVPGVYVRQEDGVGLRPNIGIRGASSDRSKKVTLLEDGVLFGPAPYSAPAAYYFPIATRMYQMRVLKGPSAIQYGPHSIGGSVDLITRPIPANASGAIDLAGGDYGYGKAHGYFGSSNEQTGFLIEGVHLRSDGFKELPTGADTGFYRNEWMFKGVHRFDPHAELTHEVRLKATYSEETSNETYLGLTDADFRRNPLARYGASALDRMAWHRTAIAATHYVQPTRKMAITTTAYRNDFSRIWRKVNDFRGRRVFDVLRAPEEAGNAPYYAVISGRADSSSLGETILIGPNQRAFVSQGVQSKVELEFETGPLTHQLEYGLRFHNDRVERRHSQDAFFYIGGQLIPANEPTEVTAFNEALTDAVAAHVFDALTWQRLTVTPGIRVELMRSIFRDRAARRSNGSATQIALPGIGAFYSVTDAFGVLAGVYRGMSPPAPDIQTRPDPEVSLNYEAGARLTTGALRAELIGYYNDYSNLTSICTFSEGCSEEALDRQFDAGEARIYGVESLVEFEAPITASLKLPLRATYTLTRTELLEDFRSDDPTFGVVQAGDELPYVPEHQAFASIGLEAERAGGYVSGNYVSKMREEAGAEPLDEVVTTDEQFTVDVGAHFKPFRFLKIYGHVRNLFDELYIVSRRPFGARPNAPRWVQVGAKVEF